MDKSRNFTSVFVILMLLGLLTIHSGCLAAVVKQESEKPPVSGEFLKREEIQVAVENYASRYLSVIGQAAWAFETELPTPEGRLNAARMKVYSFSSVIEIAAGSNPGTALLDMIVVTVLNRIVWEEYWRPLVFGAPADIMVDTYKKLEHDIWNIAEQVLTPQQIDELHEVIMEWHSQNPEQVAVNRIRFSEFGSLGRKPGLEKMKVPGGLLAPITQAVHAVDEIRLTTERALFLMTKMQLIMGLQAELLFKELVTQPETTELLENVTGFRESAEKFAHLLERLPDQLSNERRAAFTDISGLLDRERAETAEFINNIAPESRTVLKEVQGTLGMVDQSIKGFQETSVSVESLLLRTEKSGEIFTELVRSVDSLASKFETNETEEDTEPLSLDDLNVSLDRLQGTARTIYELVNSIGDVEESPLITHLVNEVSLVTEKRVDHIFYRLLQLAAVIFALTLALFIARHLIVRK